MKLIKMQYCVCFIYGRPPSSISLRAGSSFTGIGGSLHPASEIVLHPQYGNADYDIAVVKLNFLDTSFS